MRTAFIGALGALVIGTAVGVTAGTTPAQAARVVIGVAAPSQECVIFKQNRHRYRVRYAYCDAPMWTSGPVVIGGVTYRENLHYKVIGGHRHFWIKGRWVRHDHHG